MARVLALRNEVNSIPGATALVIGTSIRVRMQATSFGELAQKIMQLPDEIKWGPSKTMCDGEPVRIT